MQRLPGNYDVMFDKNRKKRYDEDNDEGGMKSNTGPELDSHWVHCNYMVSNLGWTLHSTSAPRYLIEDTNTTNNIFLLYTDTE